MEVNVVGQRALDAFNNARQYAANSSEENFSSLNDVSTTQLSAHELSNRFRVELDRTRTNNLVKPKNTAKTNRLSVPVTCLDKPREDLRSVKMKELTQRGIGPFKKVGDHGRSKASFSLQSTAEQFKNELEALYPPLLGVPFHLCKSDAKRNLIKLAENEKTPYGIKTNNALKRSCLYIVPERPLFEDSAIGSRQGRRRISLHFSDMSDDELDIMQETQSAVEPASSERESERNEQRVLVTPNSVIPNSVIPNSVIPNSVIPNSVIPNSVIPNSVIPNSVIPNSVIPNSVIPNSVIPNSVTPNSANHNSETPHAVISSEIIWQRSSGYASMTEWDYLESTIIRSRQELDIATESVKKKIDNYNSLLNPTGIMNSESVFFSRESIYDDMLQLYENNNLTTEKTLFVTFLGEEGIDLGGVSREAFSMFWDSCYKDVFKGEDSKVPFLPVSRQEETPKFKTIGLILAHHIGLMKSFPTEICRTTLLSTLKSVTEISEEMLIEDFLLFLTQAERKLVTQALMCTNLSDTLFDDLVGFYQQYDLQSIPTKSKLRSHIIKIAKSELIFKPMFLMKEIFEGMTKSQQEFFKSLTTVEIESVYIMARPTPDKVVQRLTTDIDELGLTNSQEVALYYLKNYIRNLSVKALSLFLRYVTGSTTLPKKIIVSFKRGEGLGRALNAKTCSQNIVISENFSSYQEFADMTDAVLHDKENFSLTLAWYVLEFYSRGQTYTIEAYEIYKSL